MFVGLRKTVFAALCWPRDDAGVDDEADLEVETERGDSSEEGSEQTQTTMRNKNKMKHQEEEMVGHQENAFEI